MAFKSICLGVLLSVLHCTVVLAQEKPCGGHNVKTDYFRNCPQPSPKSQSVQFHNMTFKLTDDCVFIPRGCFTVKKKITKAKVDYSVSHAPFNKKGSEDFCEQLESPDTQKRIQNYKTVPRKCTVQDITINLETSTCDSLEINLTTMREETFKYVVKNSLSKAQKCFDLTEWLFHFNYDTYWRRLVWLGMSQLLSFQIQNFYSKVAKTKIRKYEQRSFSMNHRKPGDYCITKGSTKLEQLNPKTLNLLNGPTTGKFILHHEDSKDESCVEFKFTVSKK